MIRNIVVDRLLGLVPVLGDMIFKCNTQNARELENELRRRAEHRPHRSGSGLMPRDINNTKGRYYAVGVEQGSELGRSN